LDGAVVGAAGVVDVDIAGLGRVAEVQLGDEAAVRCALEGAGDADPLAHHAPAGGGDPVRRVGGGAGRAVVAGAVGDQDLVLGIPGGGVGDLDDRLVAGRAPDAVVGGADVPLHAVAGKAEPGVGVEVEVAVHRAVAGGEL